ncbi:Rab-GTPase-TBC domain containing protein [Novymonas esmeraldas]|uniref:Rab-GTPase-TBC domain containing protein n=1 Tax=Novymonas esmeraldas TaxID=1808958 RepID=A0AAW0F4E9_9TRYP
MDSESPEAVSASSPPAVDTPPVAAPLPPPPAAAEVAAGVDPVGAVSPHRGLADGALDVEESPVSPSSPHSSGDAKAQSSLEALRRVLDSEDGDEAVRSTSLRALQRMCMRVPNLSSELTRPQRFQLYCLLLLSDDDAEGSDRDGGSGAAAASGDGEWTAYAERALETHVAVAQRVAALFPDALHVTTEELSGLLYRLGAATAFYFSPEMTEVVLCVAYVVAGSRSTDKAVLLRTLYRLLCVLQKDFLAATASRLYAPATSSLLRLMLQFYDPALATHMDQHQVDIGTYLLDWSRCLLVLQSDYDTALRVLDWVFILGDPVMVPYVAHAYLVTHRQSLTALTTREALVQHLDGLRFTLPASREDAIDPRLVDGRAAAPTPVWSGKSLLQNADLLYRITPLSTQRMLDFCLYPDVGTLNKTPEEVRQHYATTPCLPLERSDIAAAFARRGREATTHDGGGDHDGDAPPSREYIIVDCRSKESFECVRLPTAVLVGDVLSFQQEELSQAMERLESCRGHPLAISGTGRAIVEEANLLKVFALYLVNRKFFPFVCIVPGGFKTTIPLLRSGAIDAVMSPAGAEALSGAAGKSGTAGLDWGQQASTAAQSISSVFSGVSGYLAKVEGAEVRSRAEDLGAKARDGVAAAGSWGWGVVQRLRDGLSDTGERASAAIASVASGPATAPAAAATTAPSATTATATPHASQSSAVPTATAHPGAVRAAQLPQQMFSLGEDVEEDDLDLITSIPSRPLRGTVVAETPPLPTTTTAAVTTAATPARQPPATAAPSPEPVPPPSTSAAAPTAAPAAPATAPRKTSSSQIAANIDAEFDEMFGDIGVPSTAGRELGS